MKYDHSVKVNGVLYMAGEEVPAVDEVLQPVLPEDGEEKHPAKRGRKKKVEE